MIKAGTPIELIDGLSEHTIKSLNRNGIFFVKDLFKYKDNFEEIKKMPGIGDNVIKELADIWLKYGEYLNYLYRKTKNEKDDELKLSPFFKYNEGNYYLNSLCYIIFSGKNSVSKRLRNYFKENYVTFFDLIGEKDFLSIRSLGKSCLDEITEVKYKIFDYYGIDNSKKLLKLYELYSSKEIPFKQVDSLNLKDYILNFYNNLSELEKSIVLNREKWFKNSSFKSLRELGENNNMKGERIRQYGVLINSDLDFYLQYYSHYFENYIENLLELHDGFEIRKFSEIEEFSQFSYEFIGNILSKIILSNYLFHKNDLSNTFFFLRNQELGEIKNCKLFDTIDKLFNKERKVEKTETLYNITKFCLGKNVDKEVVKKIKPIVKLYLEYTFNLKEDNGKIVLPINKKDYPSLIINELILCDKRIHFSKLYNKLKIKYSQYSWSKSTVHHVLQDCPDAVNVGPGLYIHKSKKPNSQGFETIVEIIEKYLKSTKVKCATVDDIIKYVKKQKTVSDNSIKFYLMNNDKFVHIGELIFGLACNREGKLTLKKQITIVDIIEDYLKGTEDKCATTYDIINYVKNERTVSKKSIITYLWDKKRNKNKFINIGTGVYGLTKYWEGKPKLQGSKIIVNGKSISQKQKTIIEIVEKYLEETEDKCATLDDIVNYVKSQRDKSEKSIQEFIRSKQKNKNKLINIGLGIYGLTSYREGKPKLQGPKIVINGKTVLQKPKPETTVDIIEKYLEEAKNKCATVNDIVNYVKSQRPASENSIKRYLKTKNKKRNKNKFIRIGAGIYGLTSYREGKNFGNIVNK